MRLRASLVLLSCALLLGCGAERQARIEQGLAEVQREVKASGEAYYSQNRRIEELALRIALLEDKLEAKRMHETPQKLPVVHLEPEATAPTPDSPDPPDPMDEVEVTTITQADLDAMEPPMLAWRSPGTPVPPPENASMAGNIGVVPLVPVDGERQPQRAADTDPLLAYQHARRLYEAAKLDEAATAFASFNSRWPEHRYADNALYWLGVCRFERGAYEVALDKLRSLVRRYPANGKVPDALFLIGRSLEKLGRVAEGRATQSRLITMYPDSEAARKARAFIDLPSGGM